ncbi:MAG: helix-turn-helix transcriptional regulator [Muribaculaceae bacterium]|nr:helix-turn-helix transcriptional regulator [Muribaculaceae bacterium]
MEISELIGNFAFNMLAAQIGKNEATVSRWCSNKMQPSLDTHVRISELLDIDVKDLIVSNKA